MTTIQESRLMDSATRFFQQQTNKGIDWEQRRYEIAKEILPVVAVQKWNNGFIGTEEQVASWSVKYADALIEELKKKDNNGRQ